MKAMKAEIKQLSKSGFYQCKYDGRVTYHATEAGALEQAAEFEKLERKKFIDEQRDVAFGQR